MHNYPLDSYRLCLGKASGAFIILQFSLYITFGEHFVTLPNLPIPRIKPLVCFPRPLGFRVCPRRNETHRIEAPGDEFLEYSQNGH